MTTTSDKPIRLGSMLFTLVEPHRGHEVAYNRWYERDHFYAGCMIGPFCFAGRRFVATRDLKARRPEGATPVSPAPETGSYLALYWVQDGHHSDWNRWAVDQVRLLHKSGRMFAERDHVHTLLYRYAGSVSRQSDGVPPELALDHPYAGVWAVVGDVTDGDPDATRQWLSEQVVPTVLDNSSASLCLTFTPLPLLVDAPGDVPRHEANADRFLQLYFLEEGPRETGDDALASLAKTLSDTGRARLLWWSPFVPTVPGTDRYTDELW